MKTCFTQDVLAEVWTIKDSLSAGHGHSLKATCRAMYAKQKKHPGDFVDLGASAGQTKTQEKKVEASKYAMVRKQRVRTSRVSA